MSNIIFVPFLIGQTSIKSQFLTQSFAVKALEKQETENDQIDLSIHVQLSKVERDATNCVYQQISATR